MEADTGKNYGDKHSYSGLRADLLERALMGPVEERHSIVKLMIKGDPFYDKFFASNILDHADSFVESLRKSAYHTIKAMEELNKPQFIKIESSTEEIFDILKVHSLFAQYYYKIALVQAERFTTGFVQAIFHSRKKQSLLFSDLVERSYDPCALSWRYVEDFIHHCKYEFKTLMDKILCSGEWILKVNQEYFEFSKFDPLDSVIAEIHQDMIHAEELHNRFMAEPMNKALIKHPEDKFRRFPGRNVDET